MWQGVNDSEVTPDILKEASKEVSKADLKRPFRIYGTFCRVGRYAELEVLPDSR